jgi:Acyclic terpene utilisation family protein AtuA
MTAGRPLRVANCSGFYGDRLSAAREMVDGGPIDVLTGDWLAELTMGVLGRQLMNDPDAGYARTFVTQLDDVLADCLDRGIKIVSNAGGLNPAGCAKQIEAIGARIGRDVKVAVVTGDDATGAFRTARAAGWDAPHLDSGTPVSSMKAEPLLANAYLGGWAITQALAAGADVVVTGRVTDAALISGPAAWHFGWARDDWDKLAGAVAAGHVIECGAQATGGNFAFFTEIPDLSRQCLPDQPTPTYHPGFPLAEISEDGSAVITKHPGTGGAVTVDTVTAQLLYEVNGPRYLGPDVITRLDTVRLEQDGPDRVRISGVRGEPPTASVKVGALIPGGWRNEGTFVLTGLDIEEKANLAQAALWAHVPGGENAFDQVTVRLLRADRPDPPTMHEAVALLTITVSGQDPKLVAGFSRAAVETGLGSYPGLTMTAPPGKGSPVLVFWPTLLPATDFTQTVTLDSRSWDVPLVPGAGGVSEDPFGSPVVSPVSGPHPDEGRTVRLPLGTLLGARSGDKAGNATLGVWARDDAAHRWLRSWWTESRLRELLPETAGLELRLWEFPLLRACGVTVVGLLGAGVAANHALDGQAKALGEYLRAKVADIPAGLLPADASLRAGHRGERPGAAGEHRRDERLNRRPLAGSRIGQQD